MTFGFEFMLGALAAIFLVGLVAALFPYILLAGMFIVPACLLIGAGVLIFSNDDTAGIASAIIFAVVMYSALRRLKGE